MPDSPPGPFALAELTEPLFPMVPAQPALPCAIVATAFAPAGAGTKQVYKPKDARVHGVPPVSSIGRKTRPVPTTSCTILSAIRTGWPARRFSQVRRQGDVVAFRPRLFSRALKKSASGVLASLRGSPYGRARGKVPLRSHMIEASGSSEAWYVPIRLFARCGLAERPF